MRVLHFFKTYWPYTFGGIERSIHAIAKGAEKYGVQSDVLSLSKSPETNTLAFDGHMAYKAKLDFELASTGFSRDVFRHFRKLSNEADIIHFHFPWPLMDIVNLATRHGKPTIATYHSDIVKQKTLLKLYQPLMFRFLGGMDRIVATSPNYLRSSEILQAFNSKTSVIPLGLSEGDYPVAAEETKARWRSRLPKRFFLFIGVLRYYKGVHVLLEAARQTGFDVVLIGNGPVEDDLKRTVRQQNLANVHFLGALPDEDKVAILDLSLGLVFPSHLRSEAFGLSLVEAAMRGKPMISCEIGTGTSFVNLDGETGLVIQPNDAAALSQAMARLWNDHQMALSYGANARRRYETNFTAEQMAQSYAELYREVTGSR